jgi:hypothetical protein
MDSRRTPGTSLLIDSARHDRPEPWGYRQNRDVDPKGFIPLTDASLPAAWPWPWPWPDELDAMIAAPGFHTVLFEDDRFRVLDGRVPPGATVPVHTHRWGGVLYILATSDFIRRDPDGNVLADTRALRHHRLRAHQLRRPVASAAVGERLLVADRQQKTIDGKHGNRSDEVQPEPDFRNCSPGDLAY